MFIKIIYEVPSHIVFIMLLSATHTSLVYMLHCTIIQLTTDINNYDNKLMRNLIFMCFIFLSLIVQS